MPDRFAHTSAPGRLKRWAAPALLALLLAAPAPCPADEAAPAETPAGTELVETDPYAENIYNFVDVSMDPSGGIPADAEGRLEKMQRAGRLRVATDPYFEPQEFIDESRSGQDRYVGSDIELAKVIAERLQVELEIVPMDFQDVLESMEAGTCDLAISGLAYTPGRASVMTLSKGYHFSPDETGTGILIREKDAAVIAGPQDLASRNLIAQSGSLQEMLLAEHVGRYREFRRVASMQEVYDAVASGEADAAGVDIETAELYISSNPGCGLTLLEDVSFHLDQELQGDRVAAPKGENQLIAFVNGVIDEVLREDLYETWFDTYSEYSASLPRE